MDNNSEEYIGMIGEGLERHIFFHSPINKASTFSFCSNLVALEMSLNEYFEAEAKNIGFNEAKEEFEKEVNIVLHLNSPGGVVSSALMIADTIKNFKYKITCIAEGNVNSAGVIVMLACDKRIMRDHATLGLHETIHTIDAIPFNEIDSYLKDAKRINNIVKNFYLNRTNITREDLEFHFKEEAIFDKAQAFDNGFITCYS